MAKKFEVAPEDIIVVDIFSPDQPIVKCKMKNNTPLWRLMNAYSERIGLAVWQLRFFFHGRSIHQNDTPSSMKMKDGDLVEVYKAQLNKQVLNTFPLISY